MIGELDFAYLDNLNILLGALLGSGIKDPVIAGGAIRDSLLGKEVSDIDVFYTDSKDELLFKGIFTNAVPTNIKYEENTFTVTHELECFLFPVTIQLIKIHTGTIHDFVNKFPVDISKATLSIDGLTIPADFISDAHYKYLGTDNLDTLYTQKIKAKYADWNT